MTWNWQLHNWPQFRWEKDALNGLEARLYQSAGILVGGITHIGRDDREHLMVSILRDEAMETSAIEGEILDRESLQSSIRRQLGFQTDRGKVRPAEQGMAEMVINLYHTWNAPLTHQSLFAWHKMVMRGRRDLSDIGRYRSHEDTMEIVSGQVDRPKIQYVAPPRDRVKPEMDHFLSWFKETGPKGSNPMPPLERSGIAHLRFVSIHPFEDGNGRLGRAIAEKALSQAIGRPTLASFSATVAKKRKEYYRKLKSTNQSLEVTDYLRWFAETMLDAIDRTNRQVDFLVKKARLMGRLEGKINDRQEKALLRMFREGPDGFEGGLRADNYMKITGASRATTTRDLRGLGSQGALVSRGQFRYTRYFLNLSDEGGIL